MTERAILIETLTANTRSTDLVAGANMTSMSTGDTFTITPTQNRTEDLIIVIKFSGTTTVSFTAGVYPPGVRQGLGAVTIAGVNAEVRIIMLEAARVFTAAKPATIVGTNTGATALMGCFRIPRTV